MVESLKDVKGRVVAWATKTHKKQGILLKEVEDEIRRFMRTIRYVYSMLKRPIHLNIWQVKKHLLDNR